MLQNTLKKKAVNGVVWSSIEKISVQGIQFILQIFIARILEPSDYGVLGMTVFFMALAQIFIDSGFYNALIRKTDRTEIDFSTVFYFNVAIAIVFYLLFFFTSPLIANFYETPILIPILRILSLNLIFNSLKLVQTTKLIIAFDFRKQTIITVISMSISGILGIVLAYNGFGVWALVVQSVVSNGINTLLLLLCVKWKPLFCFSKNSFKQLFSYGSKLLFAGLIETVYKNLYSIVIAKVFKAKDLGYYTKADNFSKMPVTTVSSILGRVSFPVLCESQDDIHKLETVYLKYLRLSTYLIFPLMTGLAAISFPVIRLLLTEKWIQSAYYMQILCFALMWNPIFSANEYLLEVKGYSNYVLRIEIIKIILFIVIFLITFSFGISAMCYGQVICSLIVVIIHCYYSKKATNIGFYKQFKNILPSLMYSMLMFVVVLLFTTIIQSIFLQVSLGILIGVLFYILSSFLTKSKDLKVLIELLQKNK